MDMVMGIMVMGMEIIIMDINNLRSNYENQNIHY